MDLLHCIHGQSIGRYSLVSNYQVASLEWHCNEDSFVMEPVKCLSRSVVEVNIVPLIGTLCACKLCEKPVFHNELVALRLANRLLWVQLTFEYDLKYISI